MAVKGSFSTNKIGNFYLKFSWERTGYDEAKSETYIKYELVAHNTAGMYRSIWGRKLIVNGKTVYEKAAVAASEKAYYDGDIVTSGTATITGNSEGNASFSASFEGGVGQYPNSNCTGSGSWTLDRLNRYASFTEHRIAGKSSSSITVTWGADKDIDYSEYSLNGGNWTHAPAPPYTISGLAPATQYTIKTRIKRADTQMWTESGTLTETTYARTTPSIWVTGRSSTSISVGASCNVDCHNTNFRIRRHDRDWGSAQSGTTFSNLESNTTYVVGVWTQGVASGEWGSAEVWIATFPQTIPDIWQTGKTSTSVSVDSNCNVSVNHTAYRIRRHDGSWGNWQSGGYFGNLEPNTTYEVQVEKRGSDSGEYGYDTVGITTHYQTIPNIWQTSRTSTSVSVDSNCNVTTNHTAYRIRRHDGNFGSWQSHNVFTGLTPNTSYEVQVERRGTNSGEYGYASVWITTFQQTIPTITFRSNTVKSITVDSNCNVAVSRTAYRIKKSSDTNYGVWQDSNVFSNLVYNTAYDIQVEKRGTESGETAIATLSRVSTLDIARITNYNQYWNVEEPITFAVTNVGNCVMRLYLLYNNVEIIYRNNINLTNGQYVFTLTTEEKNQLYSLAAGETNPDFKFVLKSYYEGVIVGSDSDKNVSIEFPTKAWTKINEVWKRALVWGRPSAEAPWRQCVPWVDVDGNKNWKRI